jgi:hypothetical protein
LYPILRNRNLTLALFPLKASYPRETIVSQKAFAEMRGGKEITLQGDGFATEQVIVPDYWEFNTDSIGSVNVYCHN